MTNIAKLSFGELQRFVQTLHGAGFTEEDATRIIKEPNLAFVMYAAIQPKLVASVPSWYVSPEQQLERARQLWPRLAFPEPPRDFVPTTDTEVLLLHVPETFDGLWNKVNAPEGYTKWRSDYVKDSKKTLRLAPNKVEYTEPVWLAFDPEYGKGIAPNQLWGQPNLAASEVLSALIQFSDWSLSWFNGASAPNLAGYQIGTGWSGVPGLDRRGADRQLLLRGDYLPGAGLALVHLTGSLLLTVAGLATYRALAA